MKGNLRFIILILTMYGITLLTNLTMSLNSFFNENETMNGLQYKEILKHDAMLSFGIVVIVVIILWRGLKKTCQILSEGQ